VRGARPARPVADLGQVADVACRAALRVGGLERTDGGAAGAGRPVREALVTLLATRGLYIAVPALTPALRIRLTRLAARRAPARLGPVARVAVVAKRVPALVDLAVAVVVDAVADLGSRLVHLDGGAAVGLRRVGGEG